MLSRGMRKIFSIAVMVSFTGCAAGAKNVDLSYISPIQDPLANCDLIQQELSRCSPKVEDMAEQYGRGAGNDERAVGVGMVVFW